MAPLFVFRRLLVAVDYSLIPSRWETQRRQIKMSQSLEEGRQLTKVSLVGHRTHEEREVEEEDSH